MHTSVTRLHGVPESGLYWFMTFVEYHKTVLPDRSFDIKSQPSWHGQFPADRCLLVQHEDSGPNVVCVQVDDALQVGSPRFHDCEEIISPGTVCSS